MSIYDELRHEREYQEKRWGNSADDTLNTPNDFVSYITKYASNWFPGGFVPYSTKTVDEFRTSMIKVAALAIAAVESIERQRSDGGTTFYEATPSETIAA